MGDENGDVATELIRVSPRTKEWLDSMRAYPNETYDSILKSLRERLSKAVRG